MNALLHSMDLQRPPSEGILLVMNEGENEIILSFWHLNVTNGKD